MGFVLCDYFASPLLQFLFFLGSFDLKFAKKKKKKNHSMRTSLPAPLDKSCMSVRNIDAICFGTSVVQWLLFALIKCFHCGSWRTWILICLPLKSVLHLAGFFFFFFLLERMLQSSSSSSYSAVNKYLPSSWFLCLSHICHTWMF